MNKNVLKFFLVSIFIIVLSTNSLFAQEGGSFDVGATSASSVGGKVQWHGYYEFEYWSKEDNYETFDAHKLTIWMGLPINEKVFLSYEIEYEHFPRLPEPSDNKGGSGEIKIDNAQLRITPIEDTAAYLGVFYVPFGIEYYSYSGNKNKLVTRPKVMKGDIIPGTWSDVGIGLNQKIGGVGQLDIYTVNGDAKNGGVSRDRREDDGNNRKSFGVRLQLDKLITGINIGSSYVSGEYDTDSEKKSNRLGAHLSLDGDKLSGIDAAPVLIAEYVTGIDETDPSAAMEDINLVGYYAQISSRIHPVIELTARYGDYDNDTEKADNHKGEISIGTTLFLLDNFLIKGEYQMNSEEGTETDNDLTVLQIVANW